MALQNPKLFKRVVPDCLTRVCGTCQDGAGLQSTVII